jgi:hypothetical protein
MNITRKQKIASLVCFVILIITFLPLLVLIYDVGLKTALSWSSYERPSNLYIAAA